MYVCDMCVCVYVWCVCACARVGLRVCVHVGVRVRVRVCMCVCVISTTQPSNEYTEYGICPPSFSLSHHPLRHNAFIF